MIASFISLISILFGIIGAIGVGWLYKEKSSGITGDTIIGVFSSVLFIKSFGRLGFDPNYIMASGVVDYWLLAINLAVSLIGGAVGVLIVSWLKNKISSLES